MRKSLISPFSTRQKTMELFHPILDSEAEKLQGGFFRFRLFVNTPEKQVAIRIGTSSGQGEGGLKMVNIFIGLTKQPEMTEMV
jgi:hypothetical protein